MKNFILPLSASLLFAWNMKGFTTKSSAPDVKTWCYDRIWKNNFNYKGYPQIKTIEGGQACWVYSNISLPEGNNDTYEWKEGWNFVTPVFENWNLDNKFKGNALIGWTYQEGKWKIYNYDVSGIDKFNTLNPGKGMFIYIPKIEAKINTQPLFCKEGNCSKIITSNKNYKFFLKAPQNKDIKFALDLYRYSNNLHYKFAIGPFKITDNTVKVKIPVCVEKEGTGGSCKIMDNTKESFLSYQNGYLTIDAQKVANHFNKSIPNTNENFLIKLYIEGFDLDNFTNENFGTLGIENFGTWVSLKNSKRIEFKLEVK